MSNIVMMGDSITAYLPYYLNSGRSNNSGYCLEPWIIGTINDRVKVFGIENVGIESYRKYCWPKINNPEIDTYILLIGINNIVRPDCDDDGRESIEDVPEKLRAFISDILTSGASKIIIQSIYPTDRPETNKKVLYVNEKLFEICSEMGVDYLDLYATLSNEEGIITPQYSEDGVHPNKLGYSIIASKINQKLKARKIDNSNER